MMAWQSCFFKLARFIWVGSGLLFFFAASLAQAQPEIAIRFDHRDLGHYVNQQGKTVPIESNDDWQTRRESIIQYLQLVMDELPDQTKLGQVAFDVVEESETKHYLRKKLSIKITDSDKFPAWLLIPKSARDGTNHQPSAASEPTSSPSNKHPAVVALHQTNGQLGKDEVVGLSGSPNLHYGHELAERGYVVIAPDYPTLGEYEYDFGSDSFDSGSMKGIVNHMRCVDLLASLDYVDSNRIAAIGHSLGGHNAIFLAVFDERIQAVVTSCGWTPFHHYYQGDLRGWAGSRYMPRIQELYNNDPNQVPFDFYELVAAIAPRGFYSCSPLHDDNFDVEGVRLVFAEASKIYHRFNADSKIQFRYPDSAHDFPVEVRHDAYRFLDTWLSHSPRR